MRLTVLLAPLLLGIAPQEDLDRRVDDFAAKIAPGDDGVAAKLKEALKTRPGKIVLRDRAEKAAETLRRIAERDAVPDYFKARFEEKDGVFRLRAGQEDYRKRLLGEAAAAKADLDRIRPVVAEVAESMVSEPEINARLKAYLSHPATLESIYHKDLRRQTRPDIYVLLRKMGEVFAQGEDGRFFVPEAGRDKARLYAKVGETVSRTTADSAAWLKTFFEGVAPFDELHKRLKADAGDPLFSGILLQKALQNLDPNDVDSALRKYEERAAELKAKLPEVFMDTPQGKILSENAAGEVQEKLGDLDRARSKARLLREPARELVSRLRDGDELNDSFRKAFGSDAVLALLDVDVGGEDSDALAIVTARIKQALRKRDDGKYEVIPEVAEELGRELKDPVQNQAKEDRFLRVISMYGEKMDDPALKAVFTSWHGRHEVERVAKETLASKNPDGLAWWIDRHFEKGADGYRLRPASRPEIEAIVAETEKLRKEAGKNELKD